MTAQDPMVKALYKRSHRHERLTDMLFQSEVLKLIWNVSETRQVQGTFSDRSLFLFIMTLTTGEHIKAFQTHTHTHTQTSPVSGETEQREREQKADGEERERRELIGGGKGFVVPMG